MADTVQSWIPSALPDIAQARAKKTSLQRFMRLPSVQRSSVILMDVLGYSLNDIGEIMDKVGASIKAAA